MHKINIKNTDESLDSEEDEWYQDENEVCERYDYEWKKGKLIIYKDSKDKKGEKYTYLFNEDKQLVLTYNGDGFEYTSYYNEGIG